MNIKRINQLISELTQEIANNYDDLEKSGYQQETAKLMLNLIDTKKAFSNIQPAIRKESEKQQSKKIVDGKKLAELANKAEEITQQQAEYFGK
jgi:hypothetical protein